MTLTFYKQAATNNRVRKEGYLTLMGNVDGTIKEPLNISDPTIIFKYTPIVYNSNYFYCATTGRYYFYSTRDIKTLSGGRYSVTAHVDVLFTYKKELLASSAWVDVSDGAPELDDNYNMLHNDFPFRVDFDTLGCNLDGLSPFDPFAGIGANILMIIK